MKSFVVGIFLSLTYPAFAGFPSVVTGFQGEYRVVVVSTQGQCGEVLRADFLNIGKTLEGYTMDFAGAAMTQPMQVVVAPAAPTQTTYTEYVEREGYLSFMINHLDALTRRVFNLQLSTQPDASLILTVSDKEKDLATEIEKSCLVFLNLKKHVEAPAPPQTPPPGQEPASGPQDGKKPHDDGEPSDGPSVPRKPFPDQDEVRVFA